VLSRNRCPVQSQLAAGVETRHLDSGARETYTLREMSKATLRMLRRRRDIACVLVNPVQSMHLNCPAPAESTLIDSARQAGFERVI